MQKYRTSCFLCTPCIYFISFVAQNLCCAIDLCSALFFFFFDHITAEALVRSSNTIDQSGFTVGGYVEFHRRVGSTSA